MTAPRQHRLTNPSPTVDDGRDEMLHSLFDGRAKHKSVSDYDPTSQDKPSKRRARITLADYPTDFMR